MDEQLFDGVHRNKFFAELKDKKDITCPCCLRRAKIYRYKIHYSMARQLIKAYKLDGHKEFIHVRQLIMPTVAGPADFSNAHYWGLIETNEHTPDVTKTSGRWRLTKLGVDFVTDKVAVKKYANVFDGKLRDLEGDDINIKDALGIKFNYLEIMRGE